MNKVIIRLSYGERFETEMSDEDFDILINSLEGSALFICVDGLAVRREEILYVKKKAISPESG